MLYNIPPISLASEYTTLIADGERHIGWELYSDKLADQNLSSARASGESLRRSHQVCLLSRAAYRLQVIKRLTGPMAKPMEIIFPKMLANCLADIRAN